MELGVVGRCKTVHSSHMLSSVGEEEQQQQENRFLVKKKIFKREIMSPTWSFVVVVGATILGSLIGPSQSTVIPLTNQPLSQASSAAHSQAHASSAAGNSRSNPFPAHDPFGRAKVYPGMVPHYPQENGSGQKRRQTLQFTFSPEPQQQMTPGGRLLQNSSTPPLPIIKAAYTPPEVLPFPGAADPSTIIINPANIQWTAPDVPDAVSSEIINKLRLQLGNGPVTLGELNDRLIQFTTTLPNVLVNKTQITTVQETVVEEQKVQEDQKSTRTMAYQQQKKPVSASYKVTTTSSSTSGYDGHPSKTYVSYDKVAPINSLSYNPAAAVYDSSRSPPYMVGNDYQKSYSEQQYSYQVPSESSYQTNYYQPQPQPQQPSYSKPEVSYSSKPQQQQQPAYQANSAYQQAPPPPPPAYQKAPESYSKPQQQQYQPPPKTDYQKPKAEAYQQQQQQQPPKESYSAPTPPPPPYHQQQKKQQSYTSPSKEENVKIIYKYVEVCNPSSYEKLQPQSPPPPSPPQPSYKPQPQQQPKPQYPNQGQQKPNPYVEVATNLASQYPNSGEPLNLDLASTTSEAAGSAQDSQAALASVYGEIHRRMAELEQLQRYVAQVQAEVQQAAYTPIVIPQIYVPPMPTFSYSSVGPSYLEPQVPSTYYSPAPAPNYPPPPPPPPPKPAAAVSYSPPPPPPPPPLPKQQEYKVQQSSYSTPKPQPSYNTPKPQPSYSEPKPQPQQQQSYNSGQPYNGNQMTVQYVKTVEKVSQNATSPAAAY